MKRKKPKPRRASAAFEVRDGGVTIHVQVGEYEDGKPCEVFIKGGKEGSFTTGFMNAFAMSVSLGLQYGIPLQQFLHTFRDFKSEPNVINLMFQEMGVMYPEGDTK